MYIYIYKWLEEFHVVQKEEFRVVQKEEFHVVQKEEFHVVQKEDVKEEQKSRRLFPVRLRLPHRTVMVRW